MAIPRTIAMRSLAFLRELTNEYGSTKAMEIWDELAEIIGDDELKMEVFKLMLGGEVGTEIRVQGWAGYTKQSGRKMGGSGDKVTAIKTLRKWTGCGLKEAHDAVNAAEKGNTTNLPIALMASAGINSEDIPYGVLVKELEDVGLTIELV